MRLGEQSKPPTFALATKRFRAIDLSCRACDACGAGAGCWAWIPGGGLRFAPVFTPNLRYKQEMTFGQFARIIRVPHDFLDLGMIFRLLYNFANDGKQI